ncbi:TetR/AcrR family transcriptional regulator [Pseudoxanthomonas sp. JBR18]|uniref:TetR/AcrR family transcriptional regulator n=1 Tax=Pseudoxanthomonas sp. JBR18 TaxID=2969308 RepID=UPI002306B5FF|nr:TetR/AcrR family transcriptional regulator [Pseudoxanthomonas sp. JBR18]WCE05967.1 TetR/AcrR family transcriptional regulator [Pseudoxanthomonas sp. JBR18]
MQSTPSTADQILAQARTLLLAGGYNGFSYADIASRIGIRKPSIHHHFPSKAELVHVLVERYRQEARWGLAELERSTPSPALQLQRYVGYWESCIADGTAPLCVCALLASEMPQLPDDVAAEVTGYFRDLSTWLAALLERGAAQGEFQLVDTPGVEAEALMASVHGAMLSARAYGEPEVFGVVMKRALERLAPS